MAQHKSIYFDQSTQKCRWTCDSTSDFKYNYRYIGYSTRTEYEILTELLFFLYEEEEITFDQFYIIYKKLRKFCDGIKGLVDES